ncbi:uroporphyrinogen-III synthase [Pontixanthobacter sp.]|uniref:uroporphyrinogen-III synthase n=1 Tax=Pontixanthobacter sp. TaxID=2792078 RepID=UPI003C7ECF4F
MSGRQPYPIVAIRGEPGLSQTLSLAAARNLDITGIPLFEVHPATWTVPPLTDFDGLLIGSANAIRHGGSALNKLIDLPVFAVGHKTATAARNAGFTIAHVGEGGLQSVLDHEAAHAKRFLRLSGHERVPLKLRPAQKIKEVVTYFNYAVPAPEKLAMELAGGGIVMLHSAAATGHFISECERLGLDRRRITLAALGPRITEHAGSGWAGIHIASAPNDAALLTTVKSLALALGRNICQ